MVYMSAEVILFIAPFIVSIPLYIIGRKNFFKNVPQSEMHLTSRGKTFTLSIGLFHLMIAIILYFMIYF